MSGFLEKLMQTNPDFDEANKRQMLILIQDARRAMLENEPAGGPGGIGTPGAAAQWR